MSSKRKSKTAFELSYKRCLRLIDSSNKQERYMGVCGLENHPDKKTTSIPKLKDKIENDKDKKNRAKAGEVLGKIFCSDETRKYLHTLLNGLNEVGTCNGAIRGLKGCKGKNTQEANETKDGIIRVFRDSNRNGIRCEVLLSLNEINGQKSIEVLEQTATNRDESTKVRRAAIRTLTTIGTPETLRIAQQIANDKNEVECVRKEANKWL